MHQVVSQRPTWPMSPPLALRTGKVTIGYCDWLRVLCWMLWLAQLLLMSCVLGIYSGIDKSLSLVFCRQVRQCKGCYKFKLRLKKLTDELKLGVEAARSSLPRANINLLFTEFPCINFKVIVKLTFLASICTDFRLRRHNPIQLHMQSDPTTHAPLQTVASDSLSHIQMAMNWDTVDFLISELPTEVDIHPYNVQWKGLALEMTCVHPSDSVCTGQGVDNSYFGSP